MCGQVGKDEYEKFKKEVKKVQDDFYKCMKKKQLHIKPYLVNQLASHK